MKKEIVLTDYVYPPDRLPKSLILMAMKRTKDIHFLNPTQMKYVESEYGHIIITYHCVHDKFAETWMLNVITTLKEELNKLNEMYELLKDVYGLEPDMKFWWGELWSHLMKTA